MRIVFSEFKGSAPKFDNEQLADGFASVSENTRAGRLMLEPWKAPADVVGGAMPNAFVGSVYFYEHDADPTKWFTWSEDVYAVTAPLVNDLYDQVIIAEEGEVPRVTDSTQHGLGAAPSGTPSSFPLGIPRPSAPVVTGATDANPDYVPTDPAPTDDEVDTTFVSYAVAHVDGWGRIGPLSESSVSVDHKEHNFSSLYQATVTLPTTMPPIGNVGRGAPRLRIYRSNFAAGEVGDYQFLAEVDTGTATFLDNVYSGDLLDAPINEDWVGPPDLNTSLYPNGSMQKAVAVSGEFMCGHNNRLVVFSEPDAPHAWPVAYYKVFEERIVTVAAAGPNVVVLTDGFPYVLTGVHPANMSPTRLADNVPCASATGVAEIDDAIFYVAANGLYRIKGFVNMNVILPFLTESEWRALDPSSMKLSVYDGRLFISSPVAGETIVYDPRDESDGVRTVTFDAQATTQLADTNDLAYVERGTSKLVTFDSHATDYMALKWKSKVYQFNEPITFSCAKVRAKSFPVSVTFWFRHPEGDHSFTKVVESDDWFWTGFENRGRVWWATVESVEGVSRPEIFNIQMAGSPEELE